MKLARERKGLTQEQLAEAVTGTSRKQTVSAWESDTATPRAPYLRKLARELDVTVQWLLAGGDGEAQPNGSGRAQAEVRDFLSEVREILRDAEMSALHKIVLLAETRAVVAEINSGVRADAIRMAEQAGVLREENTSARLQHMERAEGPKAQTAPRGKFKQAPRPSKQPRKKKA